MNTRTLLEMTPEDKRQLLERLLAKERSAASFPLSYAQESLWLLEQLTPAAGIYNVPCAIRFNGNLDVPKLSGCIAHVVARHGSLRTRFQLEGDTPKQFVEPVGSFNVHFEGRIGADSLDEALTEASVRRFDLQTTHPFRAHLWQLDGSKHVLLLVAHHVVVDGWSMAIILGEILSFYRSPEGEGTPTEGRLNYADFVLWQRALVESGRIDTQLRDCKQRLKNVEFLELLGDRRRPLLQSGRGGSELFSLSTDVVSDIRGLAKEGGATLFMALVAIFAILISRHAATEDITVACPTSGRGRKDFDSLVGLLVNTLPIRCHARPQLTFRQFLRDVKKGAVDAFRGSDVPFERLVDAIHVKRDPGRAPLTQFMLVLQDLPLPIHSLESANAELVPVDTKTAKFDLLLEFLPASDGSLCGRLEYNADLFQPESAKELGTHYCNLAAGMRSNADCSISQLPMIDSGERDKLIKMGRSPANRSIDGCIHELFERQVAKTPDAVAVSDGSRTFTYSELNEQANGFASKLARRGATPERPIGLCLSRSVDLIASVLAIFKSGAAYVPIDPTYPTERKLLMLENADIHFVLTEQKLIENFSGISRETICIDESDADIDSSLAGTRPFRPDNLAYVLYTSGSTGQPKGVAIEHRSAVALLAWATQMLSKDELASTLFSTSICFDLSVFEMFAPLMVGGKVVVVENVLHIDLPHAKDVTLVNTIPSAMAELLAGNRLPSSIRVIALAGEPLPRQLVVEAQSRPGVSKVFNLYGPTEATTYSSYCLVDVGEGPPPIGRPIDGTRFYVLDENLEPVAINTPGELFIAGSGLARGYYRQPELTRERFLPDPFVIAKDERMYRTGDTVRYLRSGDLEYLGRNDDQIKLRGFRVELGEVESALLSHPSVQKCLATVMNVSEAARLIAAIVSTENVSDADLQAFLRVRLPEYMVPSAILRVEALPLTPAGKVDRRALSLQASPISSTEPRRSAGTELEQEIAHVWQTVLGDQLNVGLDDSFFEVGGNSLLMLRMHRTLVEQLMRDVPIVQMFRFPTIRTLARFLSQGDNSTSLERGRERAELRRELAMRRRKR